MPTNNPNIQQTQTTQQPIILQPTQQVVQQTTVSKKHMVVKSLNWSKTNEEPFNAQGRAVDLKTTANNLFKAVRENLSHLRQLNNALMSAEHFDLHYKKEHQGKEAEYKETLSKINELSRQPKDENTITELKIISDALSLDRAYIDAIFPQIIYTAMYMNDLMTIEVNQIGYKDLQAEAGVALKQLDAIEAKLSLDEKVGDSDNQSTSISSAIQIINDFNEMQECRKRILALKDQDQQLAKSTRKNFLIGMTTIIVMFIVITFILSWKGIEWADFKDLPIMSIGIPLGVCIWSFIGSFAAMLTQFYQKPIYEFGDTLKWVIIRPVLGVVMGCAIYLALYSLVLTGKNQNELLPFLVAFFVGYSDNFTFSLLGSIQEIIVNLFSSSTSEDIKNNAPTQQPVYVMTTPTQPATVVAPTTTVTTKPKPNSTETAATTTSSEHTDVPLKTYPNLDSFNEDEN